MSLPKEVQEILEKMLVSLTLKEAEDLMTHLWRKGYSGFNAQFELELGWKIQREKMEQDWIDTEWMSSDGLTEQEVANDNENYLLELEGK